MMETFVTKTNIHIEDSYKVGKRHFKAILEGLRQEGCDVFKRSMWSLQCEWIVHNLLYDLDIERERTKDVDLNYPCKGEMIYLIAGTLIYPFYGQRDIR